MKTFLLALFMLITCFFAKAQGFCDQTTEKDSVNYKIIRKNKAISNRMIFAYPPYFKKGTAPLFYVNGQRVECITYYNPEEIKTITTLNPTEAIATYGVGAKNGAVIVTLKEDVTNPYLYISTNKIWYQCKESGKEKDTTCLYYFERGGRGCHTLDLRDTGSMQKIYIGVDNFIKVRHLGAGWDRTTISVTNAISSGWGNGRIIRVTQKGIVTVTISSCPLKGECKTTVINLEVVDLPAWKEG